MSGLRSLTARLVLAMTVVAAVATGGTGLLAAPLLRGASEQAARAPLGRLADLLARLPNNELLVQRVRRRAAASDLELGLVTAAGDLRGAAVALRPRQVATLAAGRPVSGRGRLDGAPVILEARPTGRGGAVVIAASVDSVQASVTDLRRRVLLALALGLLLALGVAVGVGTWLARPLGRTAEAARRLARGERGVPLPSAGTREVDDVVQALGTLDRALSTSESRQREFLLSVSHELRTPLTAVIGLSEGLADGTVPPEEAVPVGRTLAAEARRLERYVADLLALARLEADDFGVEHAPVDLAALVADAADSWDGRTAATTVRAEVGGALWVSTDAARVRQVLDALVDNAVRVCPPGSTVVLQALADDRSAVLEVRDDGPGLTDDDRAHAFEPGVLHDRYAGTRPGGHGLGLALVHRLVGRLGGHVEALAAPEGGAAFRVVLPGGGSGGGSGGVGGPG